VGNEKRTPRQKYLTPGSRTGADGRSLQKNNRYLARDPGAGSWQLHRTYRRSVQKEKRGELGLGSASSPTQPGQGKFEVLSSAV